MLDQILSEWRAYQASKRFNTAMEGEHFQGEYYINDETKLDVFFQFTNTSINLICVDNKQMTLPVTLDRILGYVTNDNMITINCNDIPPLRLKFSGENFRCVHRALHAFINERHAADDLSPPSSRSSSEHSN